MNKTLGERIAEKRKAKGYKQDELAEMLGVSAQAVSKWERDLCYPDITVLPRIAALVGCSINDFFTDKDKKD